MLGCVLMKKGEILELRFLFRKHPHVPDDTNEFRSIVDIFILKEYFKHFLEEHVGDIT